MTTIGRVKSLFVCSLVSVLSLFALAEEGDDEYFDYTEIYRIWAHNWNDTGSAALSNPLSSNSEEIRASGRALYGLILPYMAGAGEMFTPMPEDPQYIVDLLAPDRYKRLYLGSGWINDGEVVAFMNDDDWNSVVRIIESRFERGSSEIGSTSLIENKYRGVHRTQDVTRAQELLSIREALEQVRALGNQIENPDSDVAGADLPGIVSSGEETVAATNRSPEHNRIREQGLVVTSTSQQIFATGNRTAEVDNQDASKWNPPEAQASNGFGMGWRGYGLVIVAVFGLVILRWFAIRQKGVR